MQVQGYAVGFTVSTGFPGWIIGAMIRLFTRKPGQRFRDTPSHTFLLLQTDQGFILQEAICPGVVRLRFGSYAEMRSHMKGLIYILWVTPPDPEGGLAFLGKALGDKYDYQAIDLDALALLNKIGLTEFALVDENMSEFDCSRLVDAWARASGFDVPAWPAPPSPNDMLGYFEKVETNAGSTVH